MKMTLDRGPQHAIGWLLSGSVLIIATTLLAQQPRQPTSDPGDPATPATPATPDAAVNRPETSGRLREGTKLAKVEGEIKKQKDRLAFFPSDHSEGLQILENLALERIWRVLDHSPGRTWLVSGMVTEYRGRCFLLVSRAVLKSNHAAHAILPTTADPVMARVEPTVDMPEGPGI